MAFDQLFQIDATSQMIEVALRNATTGQLLTGVAYGAVTAKYVREGGASQTTVSVVTASQGTFTSGGWIETGIAGVYQFGIPNAALASGAKAVTLVFSASGAIDVVKRVVLVVEDLRDALVSSRAAVGEAPTEAEIIAAMDADPPAANVTMLKGVAAPDAWPTAVEIRQEIDANSTLLTALAAIFSGITSLPKWLRGMYRKDAMDATAKAEVNASGGAFDEAMDSLEAIRDRGDAAWSQSGSGLYSETITVDDGTNFLDGVLVQVATDAAYSNVIRSGYTNDLGQWTFRCDTPGTYYGRAELAGKNVREFTITVSA